MARARLIIIFLIINFGGLALGTFLMNNGPRSNWYLTLNKAPWTPPGWVFGFAWTLIMICFSVYLSYLFTNNKTQKTVGLFLLQYLLNVSWNYIFFNQHLTVLALVVITTLTLVLFSFFFLFKIKPINIKYLLLPYILWLCIATSLNAYVVLNN